MRTSSSACLAASEHLRSREKESESESDKGEEGGQEETDHIIKAQRGTEIS